MLIHRSKFLLTKLFILLVFSTSLMQCAKQLVNDTIDEAEASKRHIDAAKAYLDERNTSKALGHLQKAEKSDKTSVELFPTYALLYHDDGEAKAEEG